jgi:hypothetical protein
VDDEAIRSEGAIRRGPALSLHLALDPALQLEWLDACVEESGRRTFEEAFEEPLDGGQGRHCRWRSLAEAPAVAPDGPPDP